MKRDGQTRDQLGRMIDLTEPVMVGNESDASRPIFRGIAFVVSLFASIVACVILSLSLWRDHQLVRQNLQENIDQFVSAVSFHIDQVDYTGAQNISSIFSAEPLILEILVKDHFGHVVYGDETKIHEFVAAGGTLLDRTLISRRTGGSAKPVGRATIVTDEPKVSALIWKALVIGTTVLVASLMVSTFALGAFFRWCVLPAIQRIASAIEETRRTGNHVSITSSSGVILGELISQFNRMQDGLAAAQKKQVELLNRIRSGYAELAAERHIKDHQFEILAQSLELVGVDASQFGPDGERVHSTVSNPKNQPLIHRALAAFHPTAEDFAFALAPHGISCVTVRDCSDESSGLLYSVEFSDLERENYWEFYALRFPDGDESMVCVDISHQKRTELSLVHAEKMRAVGTLTSGVAHEINNMLGVIQGNVELVQMHEHTSEACQMPLSTALQAAQNASRTVRDLLAYSRGVDEHPPSRTKCSTLLERVCEMTSLEMPDGVNFESTIVDDEWIQINVETIASALNNLVCNAFDAVAAGGSVTLRTYRASQEDPINASSNGDGAFLAIEVTDDGGGIPEALRERIFEPFVTTKQVGEGTGLGLWVAYNSAIQQGGGLHYEPVEPRGSRFVMYLPIAVAPALDNANDLIKETPMDWNLDIFLLEDQPELVSIMSQYIRRQGGRFTPAMTLAESDRIWDQRQDFDVAICDIKVPDGNGATWARRIKTLNPKCKILVLSGNPDQGIEELPYVDLVVVKPIRLQNLAGCFRSVLNKSDESERKSRRASAEEQTHGPPHSKSIVELRAQPLNHLRASRELAS